MQRVSLHFPDDLNEAVKLASDQFGVSFSEFLRFAAQEKLSRMVSANQGDQPDCFTENSPAASPHEGEPGALPEPVSQILKRISGLEDQLVFVHSDQMNLVETKLNEFFSRIEERLAGLQTTPASPAATSVSPKTEARFAQLMDRLSSIEGQLTTLQGDIQRGREQVEVGMEGDMESFSGDRNRAGMMEWMSRMEAAQSEKATQVQAALQKLNDQCAAHWDKEPAWESRLNPLIQDLNARSARWEEHHHTLQTFIETVNRLRSEGGKNNSDEGSSSLMGRFAGVEQRLETMSGRWEKLDHSLVAVGTRVEKIAEYHQLDALKKLAGGVQEGFAILETRVATVIETAFKNFKPAGNHAQELKNIREGIEKVVAERQQKEEPDLAEQMAHWFKASAFLLLVMVVTSLCSFTYAMYFFSKNLPAQPETPPGYMLMPINQATLPEEPAKGSPAENAKPNQSAARGRR